MRNEWYTPALYIEAARAVMGGIDLDPASCEQANHTVKADHFYTVEQNGLEYPWYGRIWLNPPFGRTQGASGTSMSLQKAFARKLLEEYKIGHVKQAITLSLGNPNSLWFQPFLDFPVCFFRGNLYFNRPDGSAGHFGFPVSFTYMGIEHEKEFIQVFKKFGRVARAVDGMYSPANFALW